MVRSGVYVPNYGAFGDVQGLLVLCEQAEQAGWDGFFIWDTLYLGEEPTVDPWVVLSACAARTSHIVLGALVTPVARRRPVKLARELLSLDQLSGGRVVAGVGLGGRDELRRLGEPDAAAVMVNRFEHGTVLLDRLLHGAPPGSASVHDSSRLEPPPINGRIPVWLGMAHDRPHGRQRAAKLPVSGIVPMRRPWSLQRLLSADELRVIVRDVSDEGARLSDVAMIGRRSNRECQPIEDYVDTGMTWWLEVLHPDVDSARDVDETVRSGPPSW